jgi:hypothetical protein
MTRSYTVITILAIATIPLLSGCKDDDKDSILRIRLEEQVANQDLIFDQMIYDAPAGHTFSVITLKYYLSRVKIINQTGTAIDLAELHYRDSRFSETELVWSGILPKGTYTDIEFIFGLDEVMNVDGGLPNTLENINMEWPIPGVEGYHYMKFEGKYDAYNTGEIRSFNLHTGATGGNQNYFTVSLSLTSLTLNGQDWDITLTMDLVEWLQDPEDYDFEVFGPAIMMNQTAQEALKANGSTVFSIGSVTKNGN